MDPLRPKAPVKLYVYALPLTETSTPKQKPAVWITACPDWDQAYWQAQGQSVLWLAGPLYPEAAYAFAQAVQSWAQGVWAHSWVRRSWAWWRVRRYFDIDPWRGWPAAGPPGEPEGDAWLEPPDLSNLLPLLGGRWLTWREISALGARSGQAWRARDLTQALQWGVLHQQVEARPGLRWDAGRQAWRCERCGTWCAGEVELEGTPQLSANAALTCPDCGRRRQLCPECPACAALGPVRSCTLLFRAPLPAAARLQLKSGLRLPFALTSEQRQAAQALCRFRSAAPVARYGCVEAVCGAGKSEIVLARLVEEWAQGGRSLLAIPRREIVIELSARLRSYLPADAPAPVALYGGSQEIWTSSTYLTLATTHQVLRFDRAFSLTILDEADAYPYRGTPLLERALERATLPDGQIIYLSATPSRAILRAVQQRGGVHVRLVARPHRRPLPEPILMVGDSLVVHTPLDLLWERTRAGQPLFVFVPFVRMLPEVVTKLRVVPALAGIALTSCHGHDPQREAKCEQFRTGAVRIMVCTTILERGVTIPGANVLVWAADEEQIFDTAALTQMAGRAGRSGAADPGMVVFCGRHRISRSMRQAAAAIDAANREAAARGLLSKPDRELAGPEAE